MAMLAWLLACLKLCLCLISFGCCQPELHTEAPDRYVSVNDPLGSGLASLCLCPHCSLQRTPDSWVGFHQEPSFKVPLRPSASSPVLRSWQRRFQHILSKKVEVQLAATGCCDVLQSSCLNPLSCTHVWGGSKPQVLASVLLLCKTLMGFTQFDCYSQLEINVLFCRHGTPSSPPWPPNATPWDQ